MYVVTCYIKMRKTSLLSRNTFYDELMNESWTHRTYNFLDKIMGRSIEINLQWAQFE